MASGLARNGGGKRALLSAIRQKMEEQNRVCLQPAEAVMMLEWAVECENIGCQAELLRLFDEMGGLAVLRDSVTGMR